MYRSKSVIELHTPELLLLIFCKLISHSVVTHLRCGWKYVTSVVVNLLFIPTVK